MPRPWLPSHITHCDPHWPGGAPEFNVSLFSFITANSKILKPNPRKVIYQTACAVASAFIYSISYINTAKPASLLGISAEIRMHIFDILFDETRNEIELQIQNGVYPAEHLQQMAWGANDDGAEASQALRWQANTHDVYHSIFLTSKQIRKEALDRFQITLKVVRGIAAECIKDTHGALKPVRFLNRSGVEYGWDGNLETLQPAIPADDYRDLFAEWVRQSISSIYLWSIWGLNGYYINKGQFPRLSLVVVQTILEPYQDDGNQLHPNAPGGYSPSLEAIIGYDLEPDESPYDVRAGRRDSLLVARAKEAANSHTLAEIAPLADRGFNIQIQARFHLYSHAEHGSNPPSVGASMKISFDYDTEEVLERWQWWVSPFYKQNDDVVDGKESGT